MSTTKITSLPVLTSGSISANGANTVFVVVDKSSGTPTTKQLTLQSLDSFVDNVGPIAFAHANAAFNKANSANVLAQQAFDQANIATPAFIQANTANASALAAFAQANAAFNQANTANSSDYTTISTSAGVYGNATHVAIITVTANGRVSSISNTAITGFANATFAQAAFDAANTNIIGTAAFAKANSANVLAQQAFDAANTNGSAYNAGAFAQANAAFDKANSANVLAQQAFNSANSANTFDYTLITASAGVYGNATFVPIITLTANGRVSSITNTAITGFANSTYDQAGFDKANSANVIAQAGFDKANSANVLAQNAYNYANTIAITINNTFITESRNTANAAYATANGAYTTANSSLGTSALAYTVSNTAQVTANAGFIQANSAFNKANSANVLAQQAFDGANTASNIATPAFVQANAAFNKANSANVLAQQAFDQANTNGSGYNQANTATTLAQNAYDFANTVNVYANSAYATANTNTITISGVSTRTNSAFDVANTALATAAIALNIDNAANAAFNHANTAFDQANTSATTAFFAFTQANTAQNTAVAATSTAQAAFNTANTKVSKSGDTMTGDLKFNGNGGILNLPTNQIAITANVDNDVSGLIAQATGVSTVYANTDVIIQANTGGVTSLQWNFTKEGTITFPDSTIQTTAFTGNAAAGNVSANAVGYMGMPQNNLTSNYVVTLADQGKHLYYNVATSSTVYIPTTANVAFPIGATIAIISRTSSSANVTITPNTGVSLFLAGNTTSAGRNVTTYGMATLVHVAANTWFVDGTGVSAL
jgi:hypothetical protein